MPQGCCAWRPYCTAILYSITGLPGTDAVSREKTLEYCDYLFREHLADEIKNALYVPYPMKGVCYADRGVQVLDEDWSHYDRQSFPVFCTDRMDRHTIHICMDSLHKPT